MKTIVAVILAVISLTAPSFAVTWRLVSVSIVVKQGNASGAVNTFVLSNRSYLNQVSAQFSTPKTDLFVGLREDTGEIAVVRKSDETMLYKIVSGIGTGGVASNNTTTVQFIAAPAVVSSLNVDFSGYIFDSVKRTNTGGVRACKRQLFGGFLNQTIKGTCVTTGRTINL